MDAFEELEKQKGLKKTKEEHKKILLRINKILTIVFGSIGLVFLITGIVLLFTVKELDAYLAPLIIGGVYLILAIVLNIVFRNINIDKVYDKIIKRAENGKIMTNTNEMSVRIVMLESRVKRLEEEIESLKKNNRQ